MHPQLPVADEITRSTVPVFLNLKVYDTFSPWFICPKSCVVSVKAITGVLPTISVGSPLVLVELLLQEYSQHRAGSNNISRYFFMQIAFLALQK